MVAVGKVVEEPPPYSFCSTGIILMLSSVNPVFNDTSDRPFLPDFVVYMITPLAALDPYKAAAGPPFRTETDSMSSGLISAEASP